MLQIDHRESHDVDLFLRDPQLLPYLNPENHDFQFEIMPSGYSGDGTGFLKLAFEDVGEIDFIVSQAKTENPTTNKEIDGESVLVETVPEIIAKKIIHRGASFTPRDIFDVAAAAEVDADSLVSALRSYKEDVATTLQALERLKPDFVSGAISQLQIREKFSNVAASALQRSREFLKTI